MGVPALVCNGYRIVGLGWWLGSQVVTVDVLFLCLQLVD